MATVLLAAALCVGVWAPLSAQTYYNANMYVAPGTAMSDFGTNAIFGSNADINLNGNVNLLSNAVYMDAASSIAGNGYLTFLNPDSASLPWSTHTLDANGATVGSKLVINTNGVFLGNLTVGGLTPSAGFDINVSAEVSFINGNVSTGTGLFHFLAGASHTGASQASHVNGYARKTGNTPFTFPVGNDSLYAPVGISAPAAAGDHFTANYIHTDPHAIGTALDPAILLVSSCEYWEVDRTNGSSNVALNLFWDDSRSCGVGDPSLLRAAHWNGTYWEDKGNVSFSGSNASGYLTSNVNTAFSPFTLASTSKINPLPVTMAFFTAKCRENGGVALEWRTLSEQNNDYFQVQYSENLAQWTDRERIPGAGNANQPLDYLSSQVSMTRNTQYYRLIQVDYDGTETVYGPVAVECAEKVKPIVFPNPIQSDLFYIQAPAGEGGLWYYSLTDINGKTCLNGNFSSDGSPYAVQASTLGFGTYYIRLRNSSQTYTYPLIKIKQ